MPSDEPVEQPAPGALPSLPLPVGSAVQLSSFRARVLDFKRGEAAWREVRAADSAAVPSGREPALVRVQVTGVAPGPWVGCRDFQVVGTNRIAYSQSGQLPPEPPLESAAVQAGSVFEGWCAYSIHSGDRGLILVIDEPGSGQSAGLRYVALEQRASLSRLPAADDPAVRPIGESPLAPAEPGTEVVTHDWSVKIVDVVRGAEARHLVETANPGNDPPTEGLEFVAIQLYARYHGRSGRPGLLSRAEFQVIRGNGEPYNVPTVLDVAPRLSRTMFPGAEHTGWAVFQVDPNDSEALLRFTPYFPDSEVRYFALAKSSAKAGRAFEGDRLAVPTNAGMCALTACAQAANGALAQRSARQLDLATGDLLA